MAVRRTVLAAALLVASVAVLGLAGGARAQLKEGFYDSTCPQAEKIVKDYVKAHVPHAPSIAATLIRTHFHDCFVRVRTGTRTPSSPACLPASASQLLACARACAPTNAGADIYAND